MLVLAGSVAAGCSAGSTAEPVADGPEQRTAEAIRGAQAALYSALFEDPPDYRSAATRMSSACRSEFVEPQDTVSNLFAEVELAQSVDLSEEDLLAAFSQVSYTVDGDTATGDDGSRWVYEQEQWNSEDC